MIFFGVVILITGLLMSYLTFGMIETCDAETMVGIEDPKQCPPEDVPWNLFGLYLLPGIILIGSGIILQKKNG